MNRSVFSTSMWIILLLVLGTGCSKNASQLELPTDRAKVPAFPGKVKSLVQSEKKSDGPKLLAIERIEPSGNSLWRGVVTVVFNDDMTVPGFGKAVTEGPLTFNPPLDGAYYWWGGKTLTFRPNKPLAPGSTYEVTVNNTMTSLSGKKLEKPFKFTFRSPGLKKPYLGASRYGKLQAKDHFNVRFNLPVEMNDVKANTLLLENGKRVPFKLERGKDGYGKKAKPSSRRYIVKPQNPLKFDTTYKLVVEGNITPKGGSRPIGGTMQRTFRTFGDLTVTSIKCGYRNKCNFYDRVTVYFSNPIVAKDMEKCVSISPKTNFKRTYSYGNRVSFRSTKWQSGKKYTVQVKGSCTDRFGNKLANNLKQSFVVKDRYPSISMEHGKLTVEPGKNNFYPISTINVPTKMSDVKMLHVTEKDFPNVIQYLNGWSAKNPFKYGFKPSFEQTLTTKVKNTAVNNKVNLTKALKSGNRGLVYIQAVNPNKKVSKYNRRRNRNRVNRWALVSLTDMGMTIKRSPTETFVWVTSLSSTKPQGDVAIKFWTEKGKMLWQGKTDKQGLVSGPLNEDNRTKADKRLRYVTASRGDEVSFLDVRSYSSEMPPYRFQLPYSWNPQKDNLESVIFTERGVYRAGEDVHVKGILRMATAKGLEMLDVDRVKVTVKTSRGNILVNKELTLSELGGFYLKVDLPDDAKLGSYSLAMRPVGKKYGHNRFVKYGYFRVEAYRAPRFKVKVEQVKQSLVMGDTVPVTVSGQYLFGAPMKDARVRTYATLNRADFRASKFKNFRFGDLPYWWSYWEGWNTSVSAYMSLNPKNDKDIKLNDVGKITYNYELKAKKDSKYFGARRLTVESSVSDKDSQTLSGSRGFMVHPGEYYVGVKRPGYMVETNKPFNLNVVAVDHDGNAVTGKALSVKLIKREWVSVKKKSTNGGVTWVSERKDTEVAKCTKVSAKLPVFCPMSLKNSGTYVAEVESKDSKGRLLKARSAFYAWSNNGGSSWWKRRDDSVITVVADKDQYKIGDKARLLIRSPFKKGRALITVERENVISHKIIELSNTSSSTIEVPITAEMIPNAYVGVSLIRGRIDAKTLDKRTRESSADPGKPAFKMGYAKLNVDNSGKVLKVNVQPMEKTYRPGQEASIKISLKDNQGNPTSGEVTFMAVDEGVLSLTNYKVPKPEKTFYKVRPISVRTYETRLRLIAKIQSKGRKGAPGGDGEDGMAQTKYRNKFATTATYKPTIKVDASGETTVTFKLPDNLTQFRLMAVAVGKDHRFGSGNSSITVNKPLLVRPALPRFASTGDAFKLRAVVQSLDKFTGDVTVSAEVKGALELQGDATQTLSLRAGDAKLTTFDVVAGSPGDATVRFVVKSANGDGEDAVEVKIPVKYPAATRQIVASGMLTPDSPNLWRRLLMDQTMHNSVGQLEVELSSSAFGKLLPGLEYVVGYPYGCAEQTTSRTLPMVMLEEQLKHYSVANISSENLKSYVQAGVDRLMSMQTYNGGLGYWPGAYYAHPWASVYGGLAVILAKNQGYKVNKNKYNRLIGYLKKAQKNRNRVNNTYWKAKAKMITQVYATYVLAQAGIYDASYNEYLYNNRAKLPNWGKGLLLLALNQQKMGGALTSRKAQMLSKLFAEMTKNITVANNEATMGPAERENDYWVVMPSETKSNAIALMATMAYKPQDDLVGQLSRRLLMSRRNGHWSSTQANVFAIQALSQYFETTERKAPNYDVKVGLGNKVLDTQSFKGRSLAFKRVRIPMSKLSNKNGQLLTVMRDGDGGPLYYTLKLSYSPKNPPKDAISNGFNIKRDYFFAEGPNKDKPAKDVKVGDVLRVRLTVITSENRQYVALEDPLPAGFEIINTSFRTSSRRLAQNLNKNSGDNDDWWSYWWRPPRFDYKEQKDDRVVLFSNYMRANVYAHNYLVRATTPGTFTAASARVEEMYHPNVFGQTDTKTFSIK